MWIWRNSRIIGWLKIESSSMVVKVNDYVEQRLANFLGSRAG